MDSSADKQRISGSDREPREEPSEDGRRRRRVYVPFFELDGIAYEAVNLKGKPFFLFYDDETQRFKAQSHLEDKSGTLIFPEQTNYIDYNIWLNPEDLSVPDLKQLYSEIEQFVANFFAHPEPRIIKFLSLYLIHTYVLTRSLGTVFLWLVGPKRSGKTTLQLLAERLGYRAISGINPTEAAIYRSLGAEVDYGPLILIHEYEKASPFMRLIARDGDIPGTKVARADKIGERIVVFRYHVYGARIVASNKLHGDDVDLDRYFVIRTVRGRPRLPSSLLYRDPETINTLERLRRNLLLWKLAAFNSLNIPYSDPRNQITDGREWIHFGGIITLAGMISQDLENEIRALIVEYIKEKEAEEAQFSLTELLRQIVIDLCNNAEFKHESGYRIPFSAIWDALKKECVPYIQDGAEIPTKVIGPDGSVITQTRVGKVLREQLLGKSRRWRDEDENGKERLIRGYVWDQRAIESLRPLGDAGGRSYTAVTGVTGLGGIEGPSIINHGPSLHDKGQTSSSPLPIPNKPVTTCHLSQQYIQALVEPAPEADLAQLLEQGVLIKDGEVGYRCARCSCGPYRASWAIRMHLRVCPGMRFEAAESLSSDFGAFWALINRDGSGLGPQEEGERA